MQLMGSITTSQALGAKQTNLLLRGLRLARTHSSISCFAKKGGSSCWTHMVATDPFQYVPSKSCRCSAEGVGATLFIFKQPWHRPFSEAKKSVPTPQMSREPLLPCGRSPAVLPWNSGNTFHQRRAQAARAGPRTAGKARPERSATRRHGCGFPASTNITPEHAKGLSPPPPERARGR